MRRIAAVLMLLAVIPAFAGGYAKEKDTLKWSEKMAASVMKRYPEAWRADNASKPKWDYKPGFVLIAFDALYKQTKNKSYAEYSKAYIDTFTDSTGTIAHYNSNDYNLDALNQGMLLFDLYERTKEPRYRVALQMLRKQLAEQPKTPSGGFWHKKIYPNQMWTDGIYMEAPFYTRYTVTFENGKGLNDIANQFELIHNHDMDLKTGLPYHAWDESRQIGWADKETGTSPTIWCRGVGWYAMALADVLDYFPKGNPKYKELVSYLNEIAAAAEKQQDVSGLWYQVMDKNDAEGNYLEASGSAMLAYALAKGAAKGYLPEHYKKTANKAFDGLLREMVTVDPDGEVHLSQSSQGVGLGGNPFRDGSNGYYIHAKKNVDYSVGVGAFILAAVALNR